MRTAIIIAAIIGGFCAIIAALIQSGVIFPPNGIKPGFHILPGSNILILNACDLKSAHTTLRKFMGKVFPGVYIDDQYNWLARGEIAKTRIYYIKGSFKEDAVNLEKWFPKEQYVIDYKNQSETAPPNQFPYNVVGLDGRDLVIFLGNDYRDILSLMNLKYN